LNLNGVVRRGAVGILVALGTYRLHAQDWLANNTVLIIRHAEKPADKGQNGLTDVGERRAAAYAQYFRPFRDNGVSLTVTALFAGADSEGSIRPRLTLEPLSKASGMALNTSVGTKDPAAMVASLRAQPHGEVPLLCWRHGQIPALLTAFGASPQQLLPNGKWPDDRFDWVLELRFDGAGKLVSQRRVEEELKVQ
jgi:hypothetical protein